MTPTVFGVMLWVISYGMLTWSERCSLREEFVEAFISFGSGATLFIIGCLAFFGVQK